jgi:hypothetical protein
MKYMQAKFTSKCAATGRTIRKGEEIAYDPASRKAYLKGHEPKGSDNADGRMIQSMEDDAADRWYQDAHAGY